jgi:heme oxygenase (biliverdin-IX-beta and delta-forming)
MFAPETYTPLAQQLKEQTLVEHMALEELIVPQIKVIQSIDDYAQLLNLFYGFNKPVEDAIHSIIDSSILPDISRRQKADLLLEDLKALGYTKQSSDFAAIPSLHSIEQAFGALYVLEGSTLGGKSITQLLLKQVLVCKHTRCVFSMPMAKKRARYGCRFCPG